MIDYSKILAKRYTDAEWTLDGDSYEGLTWLSSSAKPSKKTLDDLWAEVQAELIADEQNKIKAKNELLKRLGITAEEAALLLA